ncbi:MAG: uroporphyrinogen decarboxylase family protein [Acidobacteriaceae bacterium]
MNRQFYLDLAARGLRMPIGTDLVMHEENEPERVRNDGGALGRVIERAARRWGTPLAVPLMDLRLEKIDLLALAGIPAAEAEAYHFTSPMDEAMLTRLCGEQTGPLCAGSLARDEALAYIRTRQDLVPVGMAIGPFSLTTRLLADPITVTAMAGSGAEAEDSDEVRLLWQCLRMSEAAVLRSARSQIQHGARIIMICEPTACTAFISPRQLKAGSDLFERLVMGPNLRLKAALEEAGCDLIFHDCGELIDSMVEAFARRLHPVVLSLGSSRKLWEDARLVPGDVVLYGNLPSKFFYSDGAMPVEKVVLRAGELAANMKACGHPHIVGTECDVLFVPEAQDTIRKKVDAMMSGAAADGYSENASGAVSLVRQIVAGA